jgi:serine/threonine protein kinase/Flp pilus assembly protein TadD
VIDTTIKDFRLIEKLGKGGWGEVWAAEQAIVKTRVAIKLLGAEVSSDEQHVQRFFNEAIAVSKIHHAGIVKIFDVGFYGGRAYLIMELLGGETLAARIRRLGRVPLGQVAEIARQMTSVLAATHAAGITHRDLKPDNVFLVPDAELGERVKILDFGIAKLGATGSGLTATGSMGTPAYMAPEQWNDAGTANARSDVYSLGCMMFELCCGRPPFITTSVGEACNKHLHEQPPTVRSFVSSTPTELDELIARMLDKQPANRPALDEISRVVVAIAKSAPIDEPSGVAATLPPTGTHEKPSPVGSTQLDGSAAPHSRRAETPPVVASPLVETVTTLGAAAASNVVVPPRRRTWLFGVGLAVAIAAVGVYFATRTPSGAPPDPLAAKLEPPVFGDKTLAEFREPKGSSVSNLRSEVLWSSTRDDFEKACKQPGAPARWCAARDFAAGEIAVIRGDGKLAAELFRKSADADPKWAVPLIELANSLAALDRFSDALDVAKQAQRLEPEWWQAAAAGARVYARQKRMSDAIVEYRRALALSANNAVLMSEIALAYHYAQMDAEAAKYGASALAIDPDMVSIHLMRAELALEHDDSNTALTEANLALGVSPKNAAATLARGDAFALQHKKAEAFADYRVVLELRGGKNASMIADDRVTLIEAALAKDQLPAPRNNARSKPIIHPGSPNRSHPTPDAQKPRSRPGCGKADPMCNTDM